MISSLLNTAETVAVGSAEIPLLGQANLWIEDTLVDDRSIQLTQTIIQQALKKTAAGQLEVWVFDDGLSGLSSPFWPLNSSGEKILHVLNDIQDLKDTLKYLRNHVQAVKNVTQGLARNLVEFRQQVNYPVEGYKLVVLSTDYSSLSDEDQMQLAILLKAGPVAGVSFIIHSMVLDVNPFVLAMCKRLALEGDTIVAGGQKITGWTPLAAQELIETSQHIADDLNAVKMDPIAFTSVQPLDSTWGCTSEDGITFSIGRYGVQTVEVTLGDELNQRHNMLVTGAVGQGKSNLISVIIHSLCQRYSPTELRLFLLDFKEGVTLQPFFDQESGQYLPHAQVLGLEADREFGLSVFQYLFSVYRDRMRLFKSAGVQNIKQYRLDHPGEQMPRMVVIIDEFQMMFSENDKISDQIADLLIKGVRLFRACGIHIILASQTIGGNMALMGSTGEGLFGQVPVRVALKNSLAESQATLSVKNDAAVHLHAREAIVNLDYGEVSSNRKTSIAFADEKVLAPLRTEWWQMARATTNPPYVFLGEQKRSLTQDLARQKELVNSSTPVILLGARIEVDAHPLEIQFGREIGRNIAILGAGGVVPQIQTMALSLALHSSPKQFVILDLLESNADWDFSRERFIAMLTEAGQTVEVISKDQVPGVITSLSSRAQTGSGPNDIIVIGLGLDRCRTMPMEFQDLCKVGPAEGIHLIGWWSKLESFREQIGYGGEANFDTRLVMKLEPQAVKQLMNDPLLEWKETDNRALVWDAVELPTPTRIIPYSILDPDCVRLVRG